MEICNRCSNYYLERKARIEAFNAENPGNQKPLPPIGSCQLKTQIPTELSRVRTVAELDDILIQYIDNHECPTTRDALVGCVGELLSKNQATPQEISRWLGKQNISPTLRNLVEVKIATQADPSENLQAQLEL